MLICSVVSAQTSQLLTQVYLESGIHYGRVFAESKKSPGSWNRLYCQPFPQQRLLSLGSTLVEVSCGLQTCVCGIPPFFSSKTDKNQNSVCLACASTPPGSGVIVHTCSTRTIVMELGGAERGSASSLHIQGVWGSLAWARHPVSIK